MTILAVVHALNKELGKKMVLKVSLPPETIICLSQMLSSGWYMPASQTSATNTTRPLSPAGSILPAQPLMPSHSHAPVLNLAPVLTPEAADCLFPISITQDPISAPTPSPAPRAHFPAPNPNDSFVFQPGKRPIRSVLPHPKPAPKTGLRSRVPGLTNTPD